MESYHNDRGQGESDKVTLTQKLTLSSLLWGMESTCVFEHVYTMPLLQTLGLPLHLASMNALIAGISSVSIVPALGWVTDKGPNPQLRKKVAISFAAGLLIMGMICVLVANDLHVIYLRDKAAPPEVDRNSSSVSNGSDTLGTGMQFLLTGHEILFAFDGHRFSNQIHGSNTTEMHEDSSGIPFKAVLAMLGFVLMDIGFDASHAFTKSFVLACTPRSEHTSMLVVGLVVAAAGGLSTAGLGVVDFVSLLGWSDVEGGHLAQQTSAQGGVIIVFVTVGLIMSLVSGHCQQGLRHGDTHSGQSHSPPAHSTTNASFQHDQQVANRGGFLPDSPESITECGDVVGRRAHSSDHASLPCKDRHCYRPSERTPLLAGDIELPAEQSGMSHVTVVWYRKNVSAPTILKQQTTGSYVSVVCETEETSPSLTLTTEQTPFTHPSEQTAATRHNEDSPTTELPRSVRTVWGKIALVILSKYFAMGMVSIFVMVSSDFVGKAVYGGQPGLSSSAESLARYKEGVMMASWGFLVYFGSYFVSSIAHTWILAFLGRRMEYVSVHMLMAAGMLILALTKRLEVFFLLAVVAGMQRTCLMSVPFTMANDILQSMVCSSGEGKGQGRVGLAMSMVSMCVPLAYCTIFTWIGPLEAATGDVTIPFFLATAFGCVSALTFLVIGKV